MTTTHAAAYAGTERDLSHAMCGAPRDATRGPVTADWNQVDCTECIRAHNGLDHHDDCQVCAYDADFQAWHGPHKARITASQADTRQHLQAALGQIIAARAELSILHDDRCEFDCVCLPGSVHADIEAFIADAERMLRAAQALTRPVTD